MKNDAYMRAFAPRSATARIYGTVQNHTGGAVFEIDPISRMRRFLITGTAGGTYYQSEREITRENADLVQQMASSDPGVLAQLIQDISVRGIAPKVDPQLFALAVMTAASPQARQEAFAVFGSVVRTGSHLLQWARYHKSLGGKVNRSWRRAVAGWYTSRTPDKLAYQLAKYRQRDGWSQKDLIDMSHALSGQIGGEDPWRIRGALRWARGEEVPIEQLPMLLNAFNGAQAGKGSDLEALGYGLSWEMLPDEWLRKSKTWEHLIEGRQLPLTAAMRNLARMTELGVIDPYFSNPSSTLLREAFASEETLRRARLHPINVLLAQKHYATGATRSGLAYRPIPGVIEMLDDAFYASFETAPASGKRHLVGVDISSSMTWGNSGLGLSPHEIATVLAMKILRTEPASLAVGFSHKIRELGMHAKMALPDALRTTQGSFGATNPSALIAYASGHAIPVDTFVVITDNEVNRGQHVPDALRNYRKASGIDAKLVVLAVTATDFSIADPNDPGMLDVAGFGSDVPALLTEFSRGF